MVVVPDLEFGCKLLIVFLHFKVSLVIYQIRYLAWLVATHCLPVLLHNFVAQVSCLSPYLFEFLIRNVHGGSVLNLWGMLYLWFISSLGLGALIEQGGVICSLLRYLLLSRCINTLKSDFLELIHAIPRNFLTVFLVILFFLHCENIGNRLSRLFSFVLSLKLLLFADLVEVITVPESLFAIELTSYEMGAGADVFVWIRPLINICLKIIRLEICFKPVKHCVFKTCRTFFFPDNRRGVPVLAHVLLHRRKRGRWDKLSYLQACFGHILFTRWDLGVFLLNNWWPVHSLSVFIAHRDFFVGLCWWLIQRIRKLTLRGATQAIC